MTTGLYNRRGPLHRRSGLTLLDVLVLLAIAAVFAAISTASLGGFRRRAERAACADNINRFMTAMVLYAGDHDTKLPGTDNQYTPVMYYGHRDMLLKSLGDYRVLVCPALGKPFDDPQGWCYGEGPVLGYNYLGGRPGTPWSIDWPAEQTWISPQSTADDGSLALVVDLIGWSKKARLTFAPHTDRGPACYEGDYSNPLFGGIESWMLGAAGGNVGLLDGSVGWKDLSEMKIRLGCRIWQELVVMW